MEYSEQIDENGELIKNYDLIQEVGLEGAGQSSMDYSKRKVSSKPVNQPNLTPQTHIQSVSSNESQTVSEKALNPEEKQQDKKEEVKIKEKRETTKK